MTKEKRYASLLSIHLFFLVSTFVFLIVFLIIAFVIIIVFITIIL